VTSRSLQPRAKPRSSPYFGLDQTKWAEKTLELIEAHPADPEDLVSVVRNSWTSIFGSSLGSGFKIGTHIFPRPQILGFFLHELVPLEFERLYPGVWRRDSGAGDKDLVYVADDDMSIEIKTSSNKSQIFANRRRRSVSSERGWCSFMVLLPAGTRQCWAAAFGMQVLEELVYFAGMNPNSCAPPTPSLAAGDDEQPKLQQTPAGPTWLRCLPVRGDGGVQSV
jgi:hypothetical protein